MGTSFYFQICSLFYIVLLIFIYFSKKRLNLIENKFYMSLAISNVFGLILDIASVFTILNMDKYPVLNLIVTKSYLAYLVTWICILTIYIFIISTKKTGEIYNSFKPYKKFLSICLGLYFITLILLAITPLNYFNQNKVVYSYGLSANIVYLVSLLCIIVWIICMFSNFKKIKSKKYLPIFSYMLLGVVVIAVQSTYPGLLLMTSMETFVTFLMYFTIENPDLKMINELNIARDQAEKANNAKSDFLSNMSHEIRTPLNAIVGFSQALKEEELPESTKEEVSDIITASENLLEIVNGILDISKIEANKLEIINMEYSLKKIVNDLVALTKSRLGDKKLEFRVNYDESIPPVLYGDHSRLKQIVLNLLTNSVKYTREGYLELKVSSVVKDDVCRLIISVEDSGIGIKKENIDKLFSKFERFDQEKNATIEGTGLGLAITKKLVELMGGKIVVQSIYGQGSRFTIAVDQKIIFTPTTFTEIVNNNEEIDVSGKRLLIVDDNIMNLKVASRLLKNYNMEIIEAQSGIECIEKIKAGEKYDLILLDDMMPKMSGIETLQELKTIEGFNVPVIALTANAISGMREKYMNLGFDDYLSKPIERLELARVIKSFIIKK